MAKKIIAIIQARQTSKRFPDKILKTIHKELNSLDLLKIRLKTSKLIDEIIFSIPKNKKNSCLKKFLLKKNYTFFEGPENDVLKRYYLTAKEFKATDIIRITSDCPLIDGKTVDDHLKIYFKNKSNYLTNQIDRSFPDGYDIEIFSFKQLEKLNKIAKLKEDREHVTTYLKRNLENITTVNYKKDLSNLRITLDFKKDLTIIRKIFKNFNNFNFNLEQIYKYCKKNRLIVNKNNKGQSFWKIAKNILPPGSMLLSKNPDLFLKNKSPAYFKKAKGCHIWDLEKKKYIDFCYMGVGTNILGYSNENVNKAVKKVINDGNCSTLNGTEDIELAKKILEIHPWFEAVRFGRGGAETNSVAIRLSRAFNGKNNIAVCGYHGWHDWYLSANYKSKSLENFLFKDVQTKGVISNPKQKSHIFNFNNLKEFKSIMKHKNYTCVIMEVKRNLEPNVNFLKYIRKYCTKNNIVLIFDECSSGFREILGGFHKKLKIYPDISMFSKAVGNGFPITILAGKSKIMNESFNTFISSTYWSERIGPAAALATIKEMERLKSWDIICKSGDYFRKKLKKIAKRHKIKITLNSSKSIINFQIIGKYKHIVYKNFISQEMLKHKILFNDTVYISVAHTVKIIDHVLDKLDDIFKSIRIYEKSEILFSKLEQDLSSVSFFKRVN